MGDAHGMSVRRKAVAGLPEGTRNQAHKLVDGRTAGDASLHQFGQAQDATGTQHASAFGEERGPDVAFEHRAKKTGVDQIKGSIRKLQWLGEVHRAKGG